MVAPIKNRAVLAEEVAAFAERMTPSDARWGYALKAGSKIVADGRRQYILKTMPSLCRFLGYHTPSMLPSHLSHIDGQSVEAAREYWRSRGEFWKNIDPYHVCAIEPWQIGHVYFARLSDKPHVAKVGFSRRVHERLDDIQSKAGRVVIETLLVGTMADEHWWHDNWKSLHISGEWFFWPRSIDRSLPPFLAQQREAA